MSLMKIKDLFHFEKGGLQSSKCTPGEYDFITAAADWKTHNEYSHECEALIFAAAASGSLGRTHYVNGKFISSDLCFIITPKDPINYPIDLKFYHLIFQAFKDEIVRNTKAGTSKEAIGLTAFGKYKLPYFEIEKQQEVKEQFVAAQESTIGLDSQLTHQRDLVKQLRQAFLREAMQGKLVPQDPNDEPASVLLEKIKAEKERLIKEGKIKKQKPLPPITAAEIPFEIPENWVWCRLNDICLAIIDCPHSTPKYIETNTEYYGIDTNCINDKGEIIRLRGLSYESYQERVKRLVPQENDIVYAREGSIGRATFVPPDSNICLGQRVMLFRPPSAISHHFLMYVVTEESYKQRLLAKHRGMGAKHVNVKDIVESALALPPLSEQKRIVAKLDELMQYCDALEASIKASQQQNELLLQQVLREALEPK
jgi:type I restriction enzyme, S subunit